MGCSPVENRRLSTRARFPVAVEAPAGVRSERQVCGGHPVPAVRVGVELAGVRVQVVRCAAGRGPVVGVPGLSWCELLDRGAADDAEDVAGSAGVGEQAMGGAGQGRVDVADRTDRTDAVGHSGLEHGCEPGDAALHELLDHEVGCLQPSLGPGVDAVLDLHRQHRPSEGAGPGGHTGQRRGAHRQRLPRNNALRRRCRFRLRRGLGRGLGRVLCAAGGQGRHEQHGSGQAQLMAGWVLRVERWMVALGMGPMVPQKLGTSRTAAVGGRVVARQCSALDQGEGARLRKVSGRFTRRRPFRGQAALRPRSR